MTPFPIAAGSVYRLTDAHTAYAAVLGGAAERIVVAP